MAPISYFIRVKIISLMKLEWQPSWDFQKVDKILTRQKIRQIEFIKS
jgi:hypothetical protein